MKYLWLLCFMLTAICSGIAQQQTVLQLQESARSLLQQGDFDDAIMVLERARRQEPNNIEVLKSLSFANHIKTDYARAIEIGKEAIEHPDADEQAYQILGLSYKATAAYKACTKLYKTALRKFPKSGIIYNEYAELLALESNINEAIIQWEKGIEIAPAYSSNYYNATMFYIRSKNWIRTLLYGELFVNLESYTARTDDVKAGLLNAYRNLFSSNMTGQLLNETTNSGFEKNVLDIFFKVMAENKEGLHIENLIGIRARFVSEWMANKETIYPFRLFSHQQYLLSQGLFEAYNHWLFGDLIDADANRVWVTNHSKENEDFKAFQQSRVFKIPAGQYYFSVSRNSKLKDQ